jgi:hypothetical protein
MICKFRKHRRENCQRILNIILTRNVIRSSLSDKHPTMHRLLLSIVCCCFSLFAIAQQPFIFRGIPKDSALISFCDTISGYSNAISFKVDSSHTQVWRSGSSSKPFFSGTPGLRYGIMTDTAQPYGANLNEWFTVRINTFSLNPIIGFTHRIQSRAGKAGGIVEYSFDSSLWNNVVGGCFNRVWTDSFYTAADTLAGRIPAFSGTSGWRHSRFQIFQGIPLKDASACQIQWPYWVRFRFVSDSTTDTLAGWQIQSIRILMDSYRGGVDEQATNTTLEVYPNPSGTGIFNFPQMAVLSNSTISVVNMMGVEVRRQRYSEELNLSALQPGWYFYSVGGYRGRLLRQ